jgi:excisionase family DNA binding protein
MEAIQIQGITVEQLKDMLSEVATAAAKSAVDSVMKIKPDPNEDITVAEIAVLMKCSTMTVFRKLNEHRIPRFRLGRETAIKRKFLETIKKPIPKEK